MTYALDITRAYVIAKRLHEGAALELHVRCGGWLHLADACAHVLKHRHHLWTIYREAMRVGLPSEFQKPRKIRTRRDALWMRIENAGRDRVASSEQPITLRQAVIEIVQTAEGRRWYREYARTPRR